MRKRYTAKSLVMQPKFRPMVEKNKKREAKERPEVEDDFETRQRGEEHELQQMGIPVRSESEIPEED